MAAVLGVDAAWTESNPSGIALIERIGVTWRLKAAASNLGDFAQVCNLPAPADAGVGFAVACAERLLGGSPPDLVAVDMPLSHEPIVGRRASDIGVSRRFGAAKCATHSPSAERPGKVSARLHEECRARGYRLKTLTSPEHPLTLAEVYPHPALLRLMGVYERVKYKVGKTKTYWRDASRQERLANVRDALRNIARRLDEVVAGAGDAVDVETPANLSALKPVEDTIDAIVAAWVGATIIAGAAEGFGDETSAIWVPKEDLRALL
jgi:predicted RNase H-like nuclease